MDTRLRFKVGLVVPVALVALGACSGGGGDADLDAWCDANDEFWAAAGDVRATDGDDLESLVDAQGDRLDDAADAAPDDIADDAEDLAQAWTDIAGLLADADYAWADVDDDDLDKLLDESESEVTAVQAFNEEECNIQPSEGGLLPAAGDIEPADDTEQSDDTSVDQSSPPFTLPVITIDGSFPGDITIPGGSLPDDSTVIELLAEEFENMGLPADKAQCLAEQMDVTDVMEGNQPTTDELLEWVETCDFSDEDLQILADSAPDSTDDTSTTEGTSDGDVTLPGGGDIDDLVVDQLVDSLGVTEEQAQCLVDKMDLTSGTTPDISDMMDLFEECDINPLDLDSGG
jgi:hypothetical protein